MELRLLRPEMLQVDARVIDALPSMTAAIRLCQQLSGLPDKAFYGKGGIVSDAAQWSRITHSGQHNFPQDKFVLYQEICGNPVPTMFSARKLGYGLVPLETEMERRLRIERQKAEELERENALLKKLFTGRGA